MKTLIAVGVYNYDDPNNPNMYIKPGDLVGVSLKGLGLIKGEIVSCEVYSKNDYFQRKTNFILNLKDGGGCEKIEWFGETYKSCFHKSAF